MSTRLEQLLSMLQKEPNDPFLLYGMAMEYKKQGDPAAAMEYFQRTISADPGYCYAYYQIGQIHESNGDVESAKAAYRAGIAAAQKTGDLHAQSELGAALEQIAPGEG